MTTRRTLQKYATHWRQQRSVRHRSASISPSGPKQQVFSAVTPAGIPKNAYSTPYNNGQIGPASPGSIHHKPDGSGRYVSRQTARSDRGHCGSPTCRYNYARSSGTRGFRSPPPLSLPSLLLSNPTLAPVILDLLYSLASRWLARAITTSADRSSRRLTIPATSLAPSVAGQSADTSHQGRRGICRRPERQHFQKHHSRPKRLIRQNVFTGEMVRVRVQPAIPSANFILQERSSHWICPGHAPHVSLLCTTRGSHISDNWAYNGKNITYYPWPALRYSLVSTSERHDKMAAFNPYRDQSSTLLR